MNEEKKMIKRFALIHKEVQSTGDREQGFIHHFFCPVSISPLFWRLDGFAFCIDAIVIAALHKTLYSRKFEEISVHNRQTR